MTSCASERFPKGRARSRHGFKGDPYDVWVKNTLDLLDTFKNYERVVHRAGTT